MRNDERITREALYELVWSEPMLRVAERYRVSSSFMARVCQCMGVPRPPRGHWAKLSHGKPSPKPPLPALGPGMRESWRRGERVDMGDARSLPKPPARSRRLKAVVRDGPGPHPVLAGAKEVFGQGQEIDQGFLKPSKRRLADLVVTRPMLDEGIALLDELFRRFEQRGYPVSLSPGDRIYCRVGVDVRENPGKTAEHRYPSLWVPSKPTVVFIGTVAIGLTLFELTETKEARYIDGEYLPLEQAERHRPRHGWPHWSWTTQHAFATGRFCLQAYSPYPLADWSETWRERKPGDLRKRLDAIVRAVRAAAPLVAQRVEQGELAEQVRRREQEAQWQRHLAERERQRLEQARQDARDELLQIITSWGEAQRIHSFFAAAMAQARQRNDDARDVLLERLDRARSLIGEPDPLAALLGWKTPEER